MNTQPIPTNGTLAAWLETLALEACRLWRFLVADHSRTRHASGGMRLRRARPSDVIAMQAFVNGLSATDRRLRFHGAIAGCSNALASLLVQYDGVRNVVWLAWLPGTGKGAGEKLVGEARFVVDANDPSRAEIAIAIDGAHQGLGVADALLHKLLASARQVGVRTLFGDVLENNLRMRAFLRRHHFMRDHDSEPLECLRLARDLALDGTAAAAA